MHSREWLRPFSILALLAASALARTAAAQGPWPPADVAAIGYPIPPSAPTGDVRVLSLGAADLPVASTIGSERFVHVRLAASNQHDDQDWVLDAREQVLELPDGHTLSPHYAEADAGPGLARLTLHQGQRGYLDLFFQADEDPPWTALAWVVRRGPTAVAATTMFERLPADGDGYEHYWPAQYAGGSLLIGPLWCGPGWPISPALDPFSPYRRYHYRRREGGFDVARGDTLWRIQETHRPMADQTVGSRWRGQPPSAPAPSSHPVTSAPAPSSHPVTSAPAGGSHWKIEVLHPNAGHTSAPAQAASSWRERWSGIVSAVSSSSSDSSSSSRSSSSSSDSSSSSSASDSSSSPAPAAPSSPPSVGSHWRR